MRLFCQILTHALQPWVRNFLETTNQAPLVQSLNWGLRGKLTSVTGTQFSPSCSCFSFRTSMNRSSLIYESWFFADTRANSVSCAVLDQVSEVCGFLENGKFRKVILGKRFANILGRSIWGMNELCPHIFLCASEYWRWGRQVNRN